MSPGLHATLVGSAAAVVLVSATICLARNARSDSVRLHAVYSATAAWWLFSMAMVAGAESTGRAMYWAWLAQLGIAVLPAVVYHVNVAVAGRLDEHRRSVRAHYAVAAAVTLFSVGFPRLMTTPHIYSWGPYPAYTAWGLVPATAMVVVFAEVIQMYRAAVARYEPGTAEHARARAFHYGNCVAFLAAVDFLPAFGVPIYPFGFATVGLMSAATVYGSARYRRIEITPEIAAQPILDTMADGLMVVDAKHCVHMVNAAAARLLGREAATVEGQPLEAAIADPGLLRVVRAPLTATPSADEVQFTAADGTVRTVSASGVLVREPSGHPLAQVWHLHDLTEQRTAEAERHRLESWVRETQKMESLGVMAGGIAHDFNNILMAIMGHAELARLKSGSGESIDRELQTILTSTEHAAELTDQLLTYAGRDTAVAVDVDLNELSRDMGDLLRAAISKKASLDLDLARAPCMVHGDRSQLRQVVLNLVTNASEALGGESGAITLRTSLLQPSGSAARAAVVGAAPRAGRRVLLEVRDTGAGMDAATQQRIFDPFFTTKFTGRGLGLAIVFRIVQGLGGRIEVMSTPGAGTGVHVELPESDGTTTALAPGTSGATSSWVGTGVALLADDEDAVRGAVGSMLTRLGFEVVPAVDGVDAVERFRARPHDFAVVVLDVTMPRLDGRQAAAEIRRLAPAVPIVFISGYTAGTSDTGGWHDGRTVFAHKPFRMPTLAATLRAALSAQ